MASFGDNGLQGRGVKLEPVKLVLFRVGPGGDRQSVGLRLQARRSLLVGGRVGQPFRLNPTSLAEQLVNSNEQVGEFAFVFD